MAKNKVSEWSATPADNTDVGGIDINEGCAPSGINNAIRDVMAQIKDMQTGADGDGFAVSGTLAITGGFTLDGAAGTSGQVMVSAGSGNTPTWGNAFVAGMIMLWSGSSGSIPSGWLLCDGSNSTPDLRNRFVVGAGSTYAVGATGGTADAVVVSHTHSTTVTDPGHNHGWSSFTVNADGGNQATGMFTHISSWGNTVSRPTDSATTGISVSNSTTGSSGTNANLPPYYALCYIMKS
jgi:hypothetical protein